MDTCLIIGNGLNRLYDNDNSWGSLVRNLAKDRGIEARENIPLPLEFERVMNLHLENKPSIKHSEAYSRAKASLAKKINAIKLPSKQYMMK